MAARRDMVPGVFVELVCDCSRTQPMFVGEAISGGPTKEDLEECGWTFEPDRCPDCSPIDPKPLLH